MRRCEISGDLVAVTALHVGADRDGSVVDGQQCRDGLGRVVLPGTTLAGVVRQALRRIGSDELWGDKDGASIVSVFDAWASGPVSVEVRDSVSIDRVTGVAARHHLHAREVVPAGSRFRFRAVFDGRNGGPAFTDNEVDALVNLLTGPGVFVGAAGSSGLGHVRLDAPTVRSIDTAAVGTVTELRDSLLKTPQRSVRGPSPTEAVPAGHIRITVPWQPTGAVYSAVEVPGGHPDSVPLVTADVEDAKSVVRLTLPGTSVKGVLRSRAEWIARTVTGRGVATGTPFLDQMCADDLPGVVDLFGSAAQSPGGRQRGRRGALRVHEVVSTTAIPTGTWSAMVAAGEADSGMAAAVEKLNDAVRDGGLWFDLVTRNAIDRWSGGTADGVLYTALEPYGTRADSWRPMVLDLDVEGLGERTSAAFALVLFVLSDLVRGEVPFGSGVTRGSGSVTVDSGSIRIEPGPGVDVLGGTVRSGREMSLPDLLGNTEATGQLDTAWKAAITEAGTR